jgi:hypothetical protein
MQDVDEKRLTGQELKDQVEKQKDYLRQTILTG